MIDLTLRRLKNPPFRIHYTDHSRMSAMGDLKRFANHYLHNPDSRVDTFRIGHHVV